MLENGKLSRTDRSIIRRFLPRNFLVATPGSRAVSGHGGMEGLICGKDMVECATYLHIKHNVLLHPRNTLLWRSGSSAPQ